MKPVKTKSKTKAISFNSGKITAIVRFDDDIDKNFHVYYSEIARRNKAILITSDLVQAKTAQAYGLEVVFLKPKIKEEKKKFWKRFWKRK